MHIKHHVGHLPDEDCTPERRALPRDNPSLDYMDYNADCPFCGVENTLVAVIRTVYSQVPLHTDGYIVSEGRIDENVVEQVTCSECRNVVGSYHYFYHGEESGEECDCNEADEGGEV